MASDRRTDCNVLASEQVAFIDESGDAVLDPIDPQFPVFVLAICVFQRASYEALVVPSFRELKRRYFGREDVVFHERDIHQRRGMFTSIGGEARREQLMFDLTRALMESPFTVVVAVARKNELVAQQPFGPDLYQVFEYFRNETSHPFPIDVTAESQGRKEDRQLKQAFDEFQRPPGTTPAQVPGFEISFAGKTAGHIGLEIADLVAYPIARHVLGRPPTARPVSPD